MKAETIKKIIVLVIVSLLLTSCASEPAIIQMKKSPEDEEVLPTPTPQGDEGTILDEAVAAKDEKIFVHVCGEVSSPGVYELPAGSRIFEAIEMAGGFTSESHQPSVNMADKVTDGQQLVILTKEEAISNPNHVGDVTNQGGGLININKADMAMLQELNGIGEAKAKEILAHRERNGTFTSIEEIKNVSGIGEKLYERIKENITVD